MFDIREVNTFRLSAGIRYKTKKIFGITINRGMIYGLFNFLSGFVRALIYNPWSDKKLKACADGSVIFYYGRNQYNALLTIHDKLKEEGEKVVFVHTKELPMWKSYWHSLCHSFSFWKWYFSCNNDEKFIVSNDLSNFWRSYGDYKLFDRWFKSQKINRLFIANDHVSIFRACLVACNDNDVPSIYVQHAAITEKFPRLISRYSFLDGEDSLNKYRYNKELSSKVFVLGGARFDLANPGEAKTSQRIGIALTLRDEQDRWEQLVNELKIELPDYIITLRPHPRMEKDSIISFCKANGVCYSNPLQEDSFSFLKSISLLIANETSTHLDAMIMHRPTVLYTGLSSTGLRDHYGMVREGLLKYCSVFGELKELIKIPAALTPRPEKVRYYNASYKTKYEFNVSELIVKLVLGSKEVADGLEERDGITYIKYEAKE